MMSDHLVLSLFIDRQSNFVIFPRAAAQKAQRFGLNYIETVFPAEQGFKGGKHQIAVPRVEMRSSSTVKRDTSIFFINIYPWRLSLSRFFYS